MGASITLTMKCSSFNWSALTEVSRGMARTCRGISARSSELAPNLDSRVLTCIPAWADAIRAHDQCLVIGLTFPHHDLDSYLFPMFSFSRTTSSHTSSTSRTGREVFFFRAGRKANRSAMKTAYSSTVSVSWRSPITSSFASLLIKGANE